MLPCGQQTQIAQCSCNSSCFSWQRLKSTGHRHAQFRHAPKLQLKLILLGKREVHKIVAMCIASTLPDTAAPDTAAPAAVFQAKVELQTIFTMPIDTFPKYN